MPPLSPNLTDSMAITEVPEYAHLSDDDVENLAAALDTIRCDVEGSRGTKDRDYIRRAIAFQRCLEVAARLTLIGSRSKAGWALGTAALAAAKCIENMELSHNISHGQWDWMNDPEIHSSTWEWDMVGPSKHWQSSHNHLHHMFTNVVGMDDDLGFGVLRVTRDQEWEPSALAQPLRAVLLALAFEWGVALHGLYAVRDRETTEAGRSAHKRVMIRKMARQAAKDYVFFPALGRRRWRRTLGANVVANGLRNVGVRGHRLRSLRGRSGKVHPVGLGERDETRMVSPADARDRQLPSRSGVGVHERKPLLSNRTPPVSRSTEQSLPRDRSTGSRAVRQIRLALHHRSAAPAVPAHRPHDLQIGAARPIFVRDRRRRARDSVRD